MRNIDFYHTNHLGSSSWITDASGTGTQHNLCRYMFCSISRNDNFNEIDYKTIVGMQNLPFGEDFIDQRNTSFSAPYRFTGKERDTETGYDYFGARYYDSDLSIWLSVDPLSDLLPSTSSYMYCNGNPVMFVDPDGKILKPHPKSSQKFKDKYEADLKKIYNTDKGKELIDNLNALPVTIYVSDCVWGESGYNLNTRTDIQYSAFPWSSYDFDGVEYISFIALGHELQHAFDDHRKKEWYEKEYKDWGKIKQEESAIYFENYLRSVYRFNLGLDFNLRYTYSIGFLEYLGIGRTTVFDKSKDESYFNSQLERISTFKNDRHVIQNGYFIPAGTAVTGKTYENKNSSKHGTVLYL